MVKIIIFVFKLRLYYLSHQTKGLVTFLTFTNQKNMADELNNQLKNIKKTPRCHSFGQRREKWLFGIITKNYCL